MISEQPVRKHELRNSLILDLLEWARAPVPDQCVDRVLSHLRDDPDDRQFAYAATAGLAPALYHAVRERIADVPPPRRDALLSAHLTAQVRHGNLVDTAIEIIDLCRDAGVTVTLLKGISISDQHYPIPHLRPMADIDILIPEEAVPAVRSMLLERGYIPKPDHLQDEDSYHDIPLLNPTRGTWVEIHNDLFPPSSSLIRNRLFSRSQIAAQSEFSTFHHRPVKRLCNELQLVYIASYWTRDLTHNKLNPTCVPPLLDAIFLLKASRETLDWNRLFDLLDNETAAASLYLMLSCLAVSGLEHTGPLRRLASTQNLVGSVEAKIIRTLIERYALGGRAFTRLFDSTRIWETLVAPGPTAAKLLLLPWNIVFPPSAANRFSVAYQMERVSRLLRRYS